MRRYAADTVRTVLGDELQAAHDGELVLHPIVPLAPVAGASHVSVDIAFSLPPQSCGIHRAAPADGFFSDVRESTQAHAPTRERKREKVEGGIVRKYH